VDSLASPVLAANGARQRARSAARTVVVAVVMVVATTIGAVYLFGRRSVAPVVLPVGGTGVSVITPDGWTTTDLADAPEFVEAVLGRPDGAQPTGWLMSRGDDQMFVVAAPTDLAAGGIPPFPDKFGDTRVRTQSELVTPLGAGRSLSADIAGAKTVAAVYVLVSDHLIVAGMIGPHADLDAPAFRDLVGTLTARR
jgi:hypothetical protein